MAPPDLPGLPSGKRLSQNEIRERLRSKPDFESPEDLILDAATVKSFTPGVRIPWVVVTTLVTALASIVGTYYSTHAAPVDCASKGDFNALDKRLSDVERGVSNLTVTVNSNADRDHNDLEILKSAVYKKP